jgi:copper(I)-binding protein
MIKSTLAILLSLPMMVGLAHAGQADHVHAGQAWIRVLPAGLPASAYVDLRNDADQLAVIRSASSPRYGSVMLHQSMNSGGMSRMPMVDSLPIPAHGQVTLAPGGYHLMLMQVKTPVQAGESIPLTLRFADGSTLPVAFVARPANAL